MSLLVVILSDTHMRAISDSVTGLLLRNLLQEILPYLEKANLILHAGDIVEARLLDDLADYAPVHAVRGNWDTDLSVKDLPETLEVELGGVTVAMIHDSGRSIGRRNRMRKRFPDTRAIIFGHSHKHGIEDRDGLLLLNPGGGPTFALLHVEAGNVHGEIVHVDAGACSSLVDYPPLSLEPSKRPRGVDFTANTRKLLLEAADYKCQVCSSTESLQIAHIISVSEGGQGSEENGQVLCPSCRQEKTNKDRRRRELNKYLEKEPTRIVPTHVIDWVFDTLSAQGASLPIQREELCGLTVGALIATLREKEANYLALDLIKASIPDTL